MDSHGRKKRLIFFGAGASIPFFTPALTTKFLTERLQDAAIWDDLVTRYNALMNGTNEVNAGVVLKTIEQIVTNQPNSNFEEIIEIIDKIASFNFDTGDSKIFHSLLDYFRAKRDQSTDHVWENVPFLCRQLIAEQILLLEKDFKAPSYDALLLSQSKFIEFLLTEGETSFVSLNYDDVLPDSISKAELSIRIPDHFDLGHFDAGRFLNAECTVSYPHGHIRFLKNSNGIAYYSDSIVANQIRFANLKDITLQQTATLGDSKYAYNFNTFLVTGQSKESTFDENPYSAYYLRLASDIRFADQVIVIGYSFGDDHFNRLFLNFLKINPNNKILVVTRYLDEIDPIPDFTNVGSEVNKIFTKLSITGILVDPVGDDYRYRYQPDVDDVNTRGYGRLEPQLYLYKRGYDNFLSEFGYVIHTMD